MTHDAALCADIEAELKREAGLDVSGINVSVRDGIATLTGYVPSSKQRSHADWIVRHVRHVRALTQELRVRVPAQDERRDQRIAREAAAILSRMSFLPVNCVRIEVELAWVTLSGEVFWQSQKQLIGQAVANLEHVAFVSNQIEVRRQAASPMLNATRSKLSHEPDGESSDLG